MRVGAAITSLFCSICGKHTAKYNTPLPLGLPSTHNLGIDLTMLYCPPLPPRFWGETGVQSSPESADLGGDQHCYHVSDGLCVLSSPLGNWVQVCSRTLMQQHNASVHPPQTTSASPQPTNFRRSVCVGVVSAYFSKALAIL